MAPAEDLATVAVSPLALCLGIITPCAPARLAVLIMAPRLCGSSIPSRIIINGGSPLAFAASRISETYA